MPRSWQYPRWRRILLQAVLWLVLAAAAGLAALVSRQRLQSEVINLSHPVPLTGLTAMLPANWIIVPDADNLGVIATEPQNSDQQRTLIIRLLPPSPPALAAFFLLQNGLTPDNPDGQIPPVQQESDPIPIANTTGILKKSLRAYTNPTSETDQNIREELVVGALLPKHQAIIIRLTCPPEEDTQNTTLIRRLAAAISMNK